MAPEKKTLPLLSVFILTHDEEQNLPAAIASVHLLGAEVFVVDSGSTDRTVEIARAAGCHVVGHPFTTQAEQLNWALDHLPCTTDWILRLDADERLTPELVHELPIRLAEAPPEVGAFEVKRRVYFWGTWIKHGGYYPTWLVRVWRRGRARSESRQMDEHMVVSNGIVLRLDHDIIDENRKGLGFWTDKHNRYADREVRDLRAIADDQSASGGQAGRRRWMKKNLYARSPRFVRAFAYWFLRYIVLLGFLDGEAGLVFHFLQGFWYRFLVDAKLEEAERQAGRK
jgi:glycosyltransferase involved in cell wall biosynthesis